MESAVKASCGKLFHSDTEERTKDEKKELALRLHVARGPAGTKMWHRQMTILYEIYRNPLQRKLG